VNRRKGEEAGEEKVSFQSRRKGGKESFMKYQQSGKSIKIFMQRKKGGRKMSLISVEGGIMSFTV